MKKPRIHANIQEANNGPFYPVKLHAVPRAGEYIELFSLIDQEAGHTPNKQYEVVGVVHRMHDIKEDFALSKRGSHEVTVFVKPAPEELIRKRVIPTPRS